MDDEKRILLPEITPLISRRRFVTGAAAGGALLGLGLSTNLSFAATAPLVREEHLGAVVAERR